MITLPPSATTMKTAHLYLAIKKGYRYMFKNPKEVEIGLSDNFL